MLNEVMQQWWSIKKKSHSEKNPSFVHWDSSGTLTNQGKIKETSILEQLGRLG